MSDLINVILHFVIIIIYIYRYGNQHAENIYYIRMPYSHVLAAVIVIVNHDRWTNEQTGTSDSNFPF